jgi:hypothetical protein
MGSGLITYAIGCTLIYAVSRQVEPGVQLVPSILLIADCEAGPKLPLL